MNVLIAYDGSEHGDLALRDLKAAGLPDVVNAEVISVAEVWIPPEDSYTGPSIWEVAMRDVATQGRNTVANTRRSVEQAATRLRDDHPGWTVTPRVEAGPAGLRIVERAEQWPADLVVVGAQSHSVVLERLGLGSVALRVLTHLKLPVRVSRPPVHSRQPGLRLAVGVDGSPDSQAAIRAITKRSWPAGTEVRVITVLDHRVLTVPETQHVVTGTAAAASASDAIANGAAEALRRAGLSACAHLLRGDPKAVLVQVCRESEIDCLFVGARGLTGVERFLLGSVSTSVAMHAPCSVEVVHAPACRNRDGHAEPEASRT